MDSAIDRKILHSTTKKELNLSTRKISSPIPAIKQFRGLDPISLEGITIFNCFALQ